VGYMGERLLCGMLRLFRKRVLEELRVPIIRMEQ